MLSTFLWRGSALVFGGCTKNMFGDDCCEKYAERCSWLGEKGQHVIGGVPCLGTLQVVFTVKNALSADAFKLDSAAGFVFSASAFQESVGLSVMLLLSLCRRKSRQEGCRNERGDAVLEEFGSPLAILVNGIRQKDRSLTKVGHGGVMCQAAVVVATGLVVLQKVAVTGFVILLYVLLVLFCLVAISTDFYRNVAGVCGLDSALDPEDPVVGVTYVLVLLPLGVDVAEIAFLALRGQAWNATVLTLLDVVVTAVVIFPFGYKKFITSFPVVTRRLELDECRSCRTCCCHADSLIAVLFIL